MLSGSTSDRIGRRRTFQTGLVVFVLGSILCGTAPSLGWLVLFRALQAIGGSMLNPVAMSIITNTYTEPRSRARAIGVWSGVSGVSMALGPIIGGALIGSVGWRARTSRRQPGAAHPALIAAGVALAASGLLLTGLTSSTPVGTLLLAYVVFGFGLAMVNSPITNTAMSGMPRARPASPPRPPPRAARSASRSASPSPDRW